MLDNQEQPIESVHDPSYIASLLTAFQSNSKYLPLWNQLKRQGSVEISLDSRIHKHYKQYVDSLRLLAKADLAYKEFCLLTYGFELTLSRQYDKQANKITFKLTNKTAIINFE